MNSIEIEAVARMEAYTQVIAQHSHKNSILMERILKRIASVQESRYDTDDSSANSSIFDPEPPKRI